MDSNLHGGDIYSQEILWDFSTNINPLGTPEGVKEALRQSAEYCTRYPDIQCRELTAAIAAYYLTVGDKRVHPAIEAKNILCANGAADFIYQLAFALRPRFALLPAPTFSEYEHALSSCGCQVQHIFFGKEKGFAVDLKTLMKEILNLRKNEQEDKGQEKKEWEDKGREKKEREDRGQEKKEREDRGRENKEQKPEMIFLCNPNNPTGLPMKKAELEAFADFAEGEGIRLVIDECFLDFLDEPEEYSLIPVLHKYPHLVIIKAFTKLYGMAGLRLGYGLSADDELLASMQRIRQPWSVSLPAQMAGVAALKEREYVIRAKKIIARGRIQLSEGLGRLGFLVYPSRANYLFFQDLREGAEKGILYQACKQKKLLLRSCENFYGLDGSYYRICVKTKEENEQLLAVLKEVLS